MTKLGRRVFLIVAFAGSEIVALQFFLSDLNRLDEHIAPIFGDFLVVSLGAIIAVDFAVRELGAGARGILERVRPPIA